MKQPSSTPKKLITIDGLSGVGKGTVTRALAKTLGWHWLDSGALYRLTALCTKQLDMDFQNPIAVAQVAKTLSVEFKQNASDHVAIFLEGHAVQTELYTETVGKWASHIAAYPEVRAALLTFQRQYYTPQGLIADGRDMGTVVFPDAPLKIFLSASAETRASRRQKQLEAQGHPVSYIDLVQDIQARDERDQNRAASPVIPAQDAIRIDTTTIDAAQVCARILKIAQERQLTTLQ